jgi:amino acid efflux transporter
MRRSFVVVLQRTLGLGGGIAVAVGSVAGSGILFLPSVIYAVAGSDALVVWILAALVCVPLLLVIGALVRRVPDGSGLEGFVALGLGPRISALVPTLLLIVFFPAMAAAMLVAGGYVSSSPPVALAVALAIIAVTTVGALGGARGAARLQVFVVWTMLAAALVLVIVTVPRAWHGYDAVRPRFSDFGAIAGGVLVAFWGFAGFENMTFVAGELKNPRRDYLIAVAVALGGYCLLAMLLTANLGAIVPRAEVDELTGVAQLASYTPAGPVISVLAVLLVQAGASSWVWGVSRLLYSAAREGRMPAWFAAVDARGVPRRAVLCLVVPGACATCVAAVWPGLVLPFVTFASGVFVFLYALAVASFIRVRRAARGARSPTRLPDRSPPGRPPAAGSRARS